MSECRYRSNPGHVCARRDGRPLSADEECYSEARAQIEDLGYVGAVVDTILGNDR